jgi:hypothetical protein
MFSMSRPFGPTVYRHMPVDDGFKAVVSCFKFEVSRTRETWNLQHETASEISRVTHDVSKDCEAYFVPDSDVARFTNNELCRFGVSAKLCVWHAHRQLP